MAQQISGLRRLPFGEPGGRSGYTPVGGDSIVTALADAMEAQAIEDAEKVLSLARDAIGPDGGDEKTVRFAAARLCEALSAALAVAHARGERLPIVE
ncbi:hypothetical protein ACFPA8_07710 [Streptomyces ovatisporus]|uniref:DUF3077 domain-containing protein n=1 Tax=Streptomyces ovatisporus TaxID=1128682 RepID=A0ABV9A535_9ACTN